MGSIRVLTVDDHPLMREGIALLLRNEPDMELVGEASTGAEAVELVRTHRPDVTLMDLRLPDMSGIDATVAIQEEFPRQRVVILTTFEGDAEIQRALHAGVYSYVLKTTLPDELLEVIRQAHAGRKRIPAQVAAHLVEHFAEAELTSREIEVLRGMASGIRNRAIGERLFISEDTVKVHVRRILHKLAASDRTQAVAIGVRRGIIQF